MRNLVCTAVTCALIASTASLGWSSGFDYHFKNNSKEREFPSEAYYQGVASSAPSYTMSDEIEAWTEEAMDRCFQGGKLLIPAPGQVTSDVSYETHTIDLAVKHGLSGYYDGGLMGKPDKRLKEMTKAYPYRVQVNSDIDPFCQFVVRLQDYAAARAFIDDFLSGTTFRFTIPYVTMSCFPTAGKNNLDISDAMCPAVIHSSELE